MSLPQTEGLRLEQAPPLILPVAFFTAGASFLACAGLLLAILGGKAATLPWDPSTLVLTHLLTVGFLGHVMMGALFQMTPVVAGEPVPRVRFAVLVLGILAAGLLLLLSGGLAGTPSPFFTAFSLLTAGAFLFVLLVGTALLRSPAWNPTVTGMRLSLLCFLAVLLLGGLMSHGFGSGVFPGDRASFIQIHASLALLGWVGGLICAVSWQVVPMFYLCDEVPNGRRWMVLALTAAGLAPLVPLILLAWGFDHPRPGTLRLAAFLAAAPAALAVWVLQPTWILASLKTRKRRKVEISLRFWQAGLRTAFLLPPAGVLAFLGGEPRYVLLFVFLALFGWAGLCVHGMLSRILPFLYWFHRFSPLVGLHPVPSMNRLLPASIPEFGFRLHLAALLVLSAGILSTSDLLLRLGGFLLVATAASILRMVLRLQGRRPETEAG